MAIFESSDTKEKTMMMQLTDDLREKVQAAIEAKADPNALPRLREALAAVDDPQHRAALEDAAIQLAGAWADAALLVGFKMAADPSAWLFAEQS